MKNKNLINQYNQSNSLLVISSYPPRGQKYANTDTLAGFTKNRVLALRKVGQKIVVFTPITDHAETYIENDILIIRCFKKDSPISWINLLKAVYKFNFSQNLLIEFEFATFGDTFTTILFPFLLLLLKGLNKHITIELHQALLDLDKLHGHLGQPKNSLKAKFLSIGLKSFYFTVGQLSNQIIVLEAEFKLRLSKLINRNKISVVPHGVDTHLRTVNKKAARQKLGLNQNDFLILNFGYLTWYKGSDLAIRAMEHIPQKNIKLILAGGPSFTQKHKKHYQQYSSKLNASISSKQIISTGFVEEKDIPSYFSAADLVILPYRTFMSSSGPLSLALTFNKPVLLGKPLKNYLHSIDVNNAINYAGLKTTDLFVSIKPSGLAKAILIAKNPKRLTKLTQFSKTLKKYRTFDTQAEDYKKIVINSSKSIDLVQHPNLSVN